MERANEAVVPTVRLDVGRGGVLVRDPRPVAPALGRAPRRGHAAGRAGPAARGRADAVGEGSRYVGSFRAHGLVVPVWDLAPKGGGRGVEEPAAAFAGRLAEALAESKPLDGAQRRALAGLRSRQLTLR